MTDDVKAANGALVESMVRQLRDCVSVGDEMTLDHASLIDDAADWIDGEAARTAAAVAAKVEEVRSACAQAAAHWARESGLAYGEPSHLFDAVMAVPLDSTPLADEMRDEREVSQSLREQLIAAEAERDALDKLRHDYKCALEKSDADLMMVRTERDALRAQVLDAKALAMSFRCSADCARETCSDVGCIVARGVLAAMDGAKTGCRSPPHHSPRSHSPRTSPTMSDTNDALSVITDALEELGASDAVAILRDAPLYREHLELAVEIADALRSTRPELTEHRERLRQLRKSYPPSPPGLHRWNRHREALQQLRARLAPVTPPASPPPAR